MKSYKYLFLLFITAIVSFAANAQKYQYSGKVFDDNKEPLYYAVVMLKGTSVYDLTDDDGQYILKDIVPGKYTLYVTILGYQPIEKEIEITQDIVNKDFYLQESSLALDEVVVTAKVGQSKEGSTTYKIGNDAIQQVQPISVSDILQLIPGNQVSSSNLNSVAQADLRNAGGNQSVNAFGTAVIVDGNQLSTDGIMTDGLGATNSTANKGVDLREISASNIESVEVISGVPSAKYGNVTSGAIIINRKAGYTPYSFSFNSTPTSYQLGVNKGFKLKKGGFLNADGDYTYSNNSSTSRRRYYQRINAGLRYTKEISKSLEWNNNMSLRYGLGFDGQREDPDEEILIAEYENENHNISFSTNGSLNFLGKTNYSVSINYRNQYSYKKTRESGPNPIIESLEEGTYYTGFTPVLYYQSTEFYGEPVNANGRIETAQTFKTFGFRHNTNVGVEFSYNKNFGKGRVLGENNASSGIGAREMNFYNVPATENYSAYFQDDINLDRENANYLIKVGLRYDNMLRKFNLLSPRLSLSAKYYEKIRLRLAYGISYRTPSMLQLYPGPKYWDRINTQGYADDPDRAVAVVTTYIYQPTNEHLKPSKGSTLEGGFDIEHKGFNLRFTAFYKELSDGIAGEKRVWTEDYQYWDKYVDPITNEIIAFPLDSIVRVANIVSDSKNSLTSNTSGIELSLQLPKIKATNTSISLSGSYLKTYEKNEGLKITSNTLGEGGIAETRYGVYEYESTNSYIARSNITIAQHIPQIKLMLTLRAEANWIDKQELAENPSIYAMAYYSKDGTYHEIPESERANEEYVDLQKPYSYYEETPVPTYFNFHIQIRKETKQGHNFSFYANNFLWYNPTYVDEKNDNIKELNSKITFGIGFNFKL